MRSGLYLQLPSTISWQDKQALASKALEINCSGICTSTFPFMHDAFQIMTLLSKEYNLNTGIAIISPLIYPLHILVQSIRTFVDVLGDKVFIALGVGDPFFLKRFNVVTEHPFSLYKTLVSDLVLKLKDLGCFPELLLAGSGTKLLNLAKELDIGILYNGIWDFTNPMTFKSINMFAMGHFGDMITIPNVHLTIVSRMLTSLHKNDLVRLDISEQFQAKIKQLLQDNQVHELRQVLDLTTIKKLSFLGTVNQFYTLYDNFKTQNGSKLILSLSPLSQWEMLKKN